MSSRTVTDQAGLDAALADEWPSGANAATRSRFSPRLLACADLCEQQLAAWASVEAVAR